MRLEVQNCITQNLFTSAGALELDSTIFITKVCKSFLNCINHTSNNKCKQLIHGHLPNIMQLHQQYSRQFCFGPSFGLTPRLETFRLVSAQCLYFILFQSSILIRFLKIVYLCTIRKYKKWKNVSLYDQKNHTYLTHSTKSTMQCHFYMPNKQFTSHV